MALPKMLTDENFKKEVLKADQERFRAFRFSGRIVCNPCKHFETY